MKKSFILLFIFCTFISCEKDEFQIDNLNGNKISVLGHGGMGVSHLYPMNSFESIAYCLNLGADGTEIDVEMTKDSILVAFHDLELSDKTTISGTIHTKNWNEISNARYKDPIYTKYKIINLDLLFSGLKNKNEKIFSFDCKNFDPDTSAHYRNTFCNALIKIIDKYNLQENSIIQLKREDLIETLKYKRPEFKVFIYSEFNDALLVAIKYQLQGIVVPVNKITKEQVSIAHQNGLQVAVVNAHSNKRNIDAINKNADIIETDNLKHLLRILK
jgi:glycerophosphoryl diester phosphodiesterase